MLSQTSKSDTTCLPNSQLKAALVKIEQGKQAAFELKAAKRENELLSRDNLTKDSLIAVMIYRQDIFKRIEATYQQDSIIYTNHVKLLQNNISALTVSHKKEIGKQKRKTFAAKAVAGLLGAAAGYLALKQFVL